MSAMRGWIGSIQSFIGLHHDPTGRDHDDSPASQASFYKWLESRVASRSISFPIYRGTYKQALAETKAKHALLVLYFAWTLPLPTTLDPFTNNVLLDDTVWDRDLKEYTSDSLIVWVGDVKNTSFAYELSGRFGLNRLPAIVFIANVRGKLVTLKTLEGAIDRDTFVKETIDCCDALEEHKLEMETLTSSQSTNSAQLLRDEQDLAYQRSLEMDRIKEQSKREAQELKSKELELARQEALKRTELATQIRSKLPAEPSSDDPEAITLSILLPDGQKLLRRFKKADSVMDLYNYIFSKDPNLQDFNIRTLLPPQVFKKSTASLSDVGIVSNMKLIVELKDTD